METLTLSAFLAFAPPAPEPIAPGAFAAFSPPAVVTYTETRWPDTTGRMCVWNWPDQPGAEPVFLRYADSGVPQRPFALGSTPGTPVRSVAVPNTFRAVPVLYGARTPTLAQRAMFGGTSNCAVG